MYIYIQNILHSSKTEMGKNNKNKKETNQEHNILKCAALVFVRREEISDNKSVSSLASDL